MNTTFPLYESRNHDNIVQLSYLDNISTLKLFPEFDMSMVKLIIGKEHQISVAFSDTLGSGYGDDSYVDSYIKNTLTDTYRKYISEWMADNFRVSDVYIRRDRNDLGRIIIQANIASYFPKQRNEFINIINKLNDIIDSKDQQIKLLTSHINIEKNKSIFKLIVDRIKGKLTRGK